VPVVREQHRHQTPTWSLGASLDCRKTSSLGTPLSRMAWPTCFSLR
jgi:hypothetical protein